MSNPKMALASAFRKATSAAFIQQSGDDVVSFTPEYLWPIEERSGISMPRRMPT